MRRITVEEANQRGCLYCYKISSSRNLPKVRHKESIQYVNGIACPYNSCPYRSLDEYKTYEEYCENLNKKYEGIFGGLDPIYC